MKSARFACALFAVVLVAPAVFAAEDLTGTWNGSFVITQNGGEPRNDIVHMVLTQTGTELTGTAGRNAQQQWPLVKGTVAVAKVDGKESTKAAFFLLPAGAEGPTMRFDLELIDGHLKGKANLDQDGQTLAAVVDVTRVK